MIVACVYVACVWALTFVTMIAACVYMAYVWAYLHSSHVEAGGQLFEVGPLLSVDPRAQAQILRPALQAPLPSESLSHLLRHGLWLS